MGGESSWLWVPACAQLNLEKNTAESFGLFQKYYNSPTLTLYQQRSSPFCKEKMQST